MSIGAKLNALMELARGDVVMRFDDDDYYAPAYVQRMLELLGDDDFLTLSGWFLDSPMHQKFCYWQTDVRWPVHFFLSPVLPFQPAPTAGFAADWERSALNGFGFATVWRRGVADALGFPDQDGGEDLEFFDRVTNAGFRTGYAADVEGLVLHIVHGGNISRVFPQYVLPDFLLAEYFPGYTRVGAVLTGIGEGA